MTMLEGRCAYGVPRPQCHVGCGRTCRRLKDPQPPPACCGDCDKPSGHEPCAPAPPSVPGCEHPCDPWCRDAGKLCSTCRIDRNNEIDRMRRRIPA